MNDGKIALAPVSICQPGGLSSNMAMQYGLPLDCFNVFSAVKSLTNSRSRRRFLKC